MIKLKKIFNKLYFQLSAVTTFILVLWFVTLVLGANYFNIQKRNQEIYSETQKVELTLSKIQPILLDYVLLDDYLAVEQMLVNIKKDLALDYISYKSEKNTIESGSFLKDKPNIELVLPIHLQDKEFGQVFIQKNVKFDSLFSIVVFKLILFFLVLIFGMFYYTNRFISRRIVAPIKTIINNAGSFDKISIDNFKFNTSQEITDLHELILMMASRITQFQKQIAQQAQKEAILQMATQVAHDIRSPLAALNSLEKELENLPESKRILLRGAISRINDIANNLIEQNQTIDSNESNMLYEAVLLSALIGPIISEKRILIRNKMNIKIQENYQQLGYGLFAKVNPSHFKRVISNLIQNSIESFKEDEGIINIDLRVAINDSSKIILSISDNGCGMPKDILNKIGQRGESYNKSGGSGLGLYHAFKVIEGYSGTLEIESDVGIGTTVKITLPAAQAPSWFVPSITISSRDTVIAVLDDDDSIHQVWKGRFESSIPNAGHYKICSFVSTEAFEKFCTSSKPDLCLVDYEIIGSLATGLEVIEKLNIADIAILVTSRYEEQHIRERCDQLGVKMLPKGMAAFVPIQFTSDEMKDLNAQNSSNSAVTAVLIDDDDLVHMVWSRSAKRSNKKILLFKQSSEFEDYFKNHILALTTPIYVDVSLGNGVNGVDVAKHLHGMGYTNIYLMTGHAPEQFKGLSFIAGVVGKEPRV